MTGVQGSMSASRPRTAGCGTAGWGMGDGVGGCSLVSGVDSLIFKEAPIIAPLLLRVSLRIMRGSIYIYRWWGCSMVFMELLSFTVVPSSLVYLRGVLSVHFIHHLFHCSIICVITYMCIVTVENIQFSCLRYDLWEHKIWGSALEINLILFFFFFCLHEYRQQSMCDSIN